MAELWAAIGRETSRRRGPALTAYEYELTEEVARHFTLLAKAYRARAERETRDVDFDDLPTPVRGLGEILDGMMFVDDDPTDPTIVLRPGKDPP